MPQIVQNIPRKDYRIVVADDNAKVLQLLKKNFEKIGIQIQTCMKREELQKCLEQQQADVLVVDETMEDCSGVDFCMSLAGRYPDMLKLIIIDGVSREMAEARQKGIIDGYVENRYRIPRFLRQFGIVPAGRYKKKDADICKV